MPLFGPEKQPRTSIESRNAGPSSQVFGVHLLVAAISFLLLIGTIHAQATLSQTISIPPVPDRPVTSAPFRIVAIASSGLPVTLSANGSVTLDGRRQLTLTGVGEVTVSASQAGNTQYAAAPDATLTFNVTPAPTSVAWQPSNLTYGMPLSASGLNATASAVPLVSTAADAATVTSQLNTSEINAGEPLSYPASSPVFRYEGSAMEPSPYAASLGSMVPDGMAPPYNPVFRVAFTCNCQQFEYVVQSRQSTYWLWVDGAYTTPDFINIDPGSYPDLNFVRVQFPDKRPRQIKVSLGGAPPFFGVMTAGSDTISAPQVPIGEKVIIFGDSWTGPTIVQPAIPPEQDGTSGEGYPLVLGDYFNWNQSDEGIGGEGFTEVGTDANGATFQQRILTDVCPYSPAAIVIMGGVNDDPATTAQMEAALTTTFNSLASCLPAVPIYLYGPQKPSPHIEAAFAAVVPNFSNIHYTNMGGQQWLYGDPTSSATGNAYLYLNGHPTPLGHFYLAEKLAADLISVFPSLAPSPYSVLAPMAAAGTFAYSEQPTALLPAGHDFVTATFLPADAINYAPSSLRATIAVAKAATTTALTATGGSGARTIAIFIEPQIAGTPSGIVAVSEQGKTLSTLTLSGGWATYNASSLATGSHALTFSYPGDWNFTSSDATITVGVVQGAADFSVLANPAQLTVAFGTPASVSLLITPSGGLAATLTLSCAGLPAASQCVLAAGSAIQVLGAPVNAAVTINVTALAYTETPPLQTRPDNEELAVCGLLGAGLLTLGSGKKMKYFSAVLLACVVLGVSGCGAVLNRSVMPLATPATYTVQLTLTDAADAALNHGTSITLTVK